MMKKTRAQIRSQTLKAKEIPSLWNKVLRCYLTKDVTLGVVLEKDALRNATLRPVTVSRRSAAWQAYFMSWNQKIFLHSPLTKKRSICFLTGRSRSVYRAFHLSRLKIREFGAMGFFSGLSKASW